MEGMYQSGKIVFNSITQNMALGWTSSILFWIMEHFNSIAGMILTGSVTFFTILKAREEYMAVKQEERRKQERHEQELRQDQERHEQERNSST